MDFENLDDQALMQRIAEKESDALGVLYDRYGRLVKLCLRGCLSEGRGTWSCTENHREA
ncbi:MAG: hypothetical protein GY943_37910 [Chloroflexi bacterium]|nr:hypothetical protein [Chloroflexota bacterium]